MSNIRHQGAVQRRVSLALPAASMLAVLVLAGCGQAPEVDPELTATLIQPVARVELQLAKEEPGRRTGEQIYQSICTGCHAAAVLGAPGTGDTAAWAPRLESGFEALVASVINGKGAMPPRGGGADLTDVEVQRATAYLANQAGASFTEPPVE